MILGETMFTKLAAIHSLHKLGYTYIQAIKA